jgi:branched-chain amino acid aminotransferase
MKMESIAYFNGELQPWSRTKISVLDYGFLFGYSLFETMRAYDGAVFSLDRHLDRLAKSAALLGLPVERNSWAKAVGSVIEANKLKEARVRLVLSAGPGSLTPDLQSCRQPTLLALAIPYTPPAPEIYSRGYRVIISSVHRNSQSPLPGLKSSNFLESLLARQEARKAGADDALLLNDKGFLAEASSSNVFTVKRGKLLTPGLGSGILPGITRSLILEMAATLKIVAQESDISPGELMAADEAFISNSMIEIMPVSEVNGKKIGAGQAGPITLKLRQAYRSSVPGA